MEVKVYIEDRDREVLRRTITILLLCRLLLLFSISMCIYYVCIVLL